MWLPATDLVVTVAGEGGGGGEGAPATGGIDRGRSSVGQLEEEGCVTDGEQL